MTITDVRIHPVVSERHYTTTIAKPGQGLQEGVERSYYLILEVNTDEGITGFGEVSDINRVPDLAETTQILKAALVGEGPFNTERVLDKLLVGTPLICAVDLALHDLQGKLLNRPVSDLMGGRVRDRVLASWVVYIRGAEHLDEEVSAKVEMGFKAFKMKVGADLDLDERRVQIVREIAGEEAEIKLDANGAWTVEQAIECITRLSRYDIAGVETPIPPEDVDAMVVVRKNVEVPIIEHGGISPRHLEMIQKGAVDAFKISVCSGGIRRAKKIATLAEVGGVACYVGSTVEMGPGTAAGIHFAVSTKNTDRYGADLRGPLLLKDDVLSTPIQYTDGYLQIPEGPGLGVEIDRGQLEALRFDPAAEMGR